MELGKCGAGFLDRYMLDFPRKKSYFLLLLLLERSKGSHRYTRALAAHSESTLTLLKVTSSNFPGSTINYPFLRHYGNSIFILTAQNESVPFSPHREISLLLAPDTAFLAPPIL